MISLNNIHHAMQAYQGPIKQPSSYKEDEIEGLKAQKSKFENQITDLQGDNNEDSQTKLGRVQNDLASVEDKLENLKSISTVNPSEPTPPPKEIPSDEEMNHRFGDAYSVELSHIKTSRMAEE
ncbi:hypothetical protein [Selenomonas ruminantium]|uniref:hypothetical protein n=1 Tax=Selenomonas ruminantium TaxID=971 RepID=UPI000945CF13|nr:hypothetical protein [Selenomonas ruminantium]